jgi:hypothetical protein
MCQMETPMGKHMGMMNQMCGREGGFPLIGDKMPRMEVKTTHGMMTLPDAYLRKVVCVLQPSWRLYAGMHNRICGL